MVNFIVDSTFGLSRGYAEEHNIGVVNLTLNIGAKEYTEGYREDWGAFYSDYTRSKVGAKTSQPAPAAFIDAINGVLSKDPDGDIIILTIGDRLSGTISSAKIATLQFPDRKIAAIDSHNGGVSSYMMLQEMIKARDSGLGFDELVSYADTIKDRFCTRFIALSMAELARGGRVNKLLSRLGSILNIKPVFQYFRNELTVLSKPIGTKSAIVNAVNAVPKDFERIAICYIHDDRLVEPLKDRLFRTFGMSHIDVEPMCPVGCAHIGLGTVGIVTLEKDKKV